MLISKLNFTYLLIWIFWQYDTRARHPHLTLAGIMPATCRYRFPRQWLLFLLAFRKRLTFFSFIFRSHVLEKVCTYFSYKVRYTNSNTEIPEFPIQADIALELLMAANFLDCWHDKPCFNFSWIDFKCCYIWEWCFNSGQAIQGIHYKHCFVDLLKASWPRPVSSSNGKISYLKSLYITL